jgi:hypothetical protein
MAKKPLFPGSYFTYKTESRFFGLRHEWGLAQLVGEEPLGGILHVRILSKDPDPSQGGVIVWHLPMTFEAVARSLSNVLDLRPVPHDAEPHITRWRAVFKTNGDAVFKQSIYDALKEIGAAAGDREAAIESAWPRPRGGIEIIFEEQSGES